MYWEISEGSSECIFGFVIKLHFLTQRRNGAKKTLRLCAAA
jgi:hypothetical protein